MFLEGASEFEVYALWITFFVAIIGLIYSFLLKKYVMNQDVGTKEMQEISGAIQEGAEAYLKKQLRTAVVVIAILSIALFLTAYVGQPRDWIADGNTQSEWMLISIGRALAFLMGSGFSAAAGYFGMLMAVRANVRVAQAARKSLREAVTIAYRTGSIVGMLTAGLGLLGGVVVFMIYDIHAPEVLLGFGFGGTIIALFMRVGGGIFTKAADVGADLVGKVEKGIPEDDPRNAAVIADNVGDNVGDCAGMAADIFESYEVTMVSAMILGLAAFAGNLRMQYIAVVFPLLIRAVGVLASILGTYTVRSKTENEDVLKSINRGYKISAFISVAGFVVLALFWVQGASIDAGYTGANAISNVGIKFAAATGAGIVMALVLNYVTEYFTSTEHRPVRDIAKTTQTGSATTILSGLAWGMESSVWALLVIVGAMVASALIFPANQPFLVAYGVSLCGIGMLTLTGNTLSMDTFGPIADNANGIGEMCGLEPEARQRMADMDAVGNTTKAITKGVAIGSAVIAGISLFMDYIVRAQEAGSTLLSTSVDPATGLMVLPIQISTPIFFAALLIGGSIPFLFSAMSIRAVERAAGLIVIEVRRQFREIKGIWEGTAKPDYAKPVEISTEAAQKELVGLATLTILSPIIVGLIFNEVALGAFLAGAILAAQLMAVFMANAGGAWDNAKKYVEDGHYGGKGTDAHKASIVGDTVGDPLKDTAGPALNPMVKAINLIAVLIVPVIVKYNLGAISFSREPGTFLMVLAGIALMIFGVAYAVVVSKRVVSKGKKRKGGKRPRKPKQPPVIGSGDVPDEETIPAPEVQETISEAEEIKPETNE